MEKRDNDLGNFRLGRLLCVFAFIVRLGFVDKTSFSFAMKTLIYIMKLCIGICP
jgi:hypothetical protein